MVYYILEKIKQMSHSYNAIWIHSIWSTKDRKALINSDVEEKIFNYIRGQFIEQGCPVRIINGMPDHVHALFLLNPKKDIASIIKQVKGSTSHWVNQNNILSEKFAWQTGYASYSVSDSVKDKVFAYIKNQKSHHLKKSFTKEYEEFITLHNQANG